MTLWAVIKSAFLTFVAKTVPALATGNPFRGSCVHPTRPPLWGFPTGPSVGGDSTRPSSLIPTFFDPGLRSAISPRSPGSFHWRWSQTTIWAPGVLAAAAHTHTPPPPNARQDQETHARLLSNTGVRVLQRGEAGFLLENKATIQLSTDGTCDLTTLTPRRSDQPCVEPAHVSGKGHWVSLWCSFQTHVQDSREAMSARQLLRQNVPFLKPVCTAGGAVIPHQKVRHLQEWNSHAEAPPARGTRKELRDCSTWARDTPDSGPQPPHCCTRWPVCRSAAGSGQNLRHAAPIKHLLSTPTSQIPFREG